MDWIKVKTKHILFEYEDLSDKEFKAWIQIMALTAFLGHEPTYDQMIKTVHHKTLKSLQEKLKNHSTTLQDILKKVLRDVQDIDIKRSKGRLKKRQQRDNLRLNRQNVPGDIPGDVPGDVPGADKIEIREDIYKKNTSNKLEVKKSTQKRAVFSPPSQNQINSFFSEYSIQNQLTLVDPVNDPVEFHDFYASKNWMVGKVKMKDWKAAGRRWMRKNNEERKLKGDVKREYTGDEFYRAAFSGRSILENLTAV